MSRLGQSFYSANKIRLWLKERETENRRRISSLPWLILIFSHLFAHPPVGDSIDIETLSKNAIEVEKVVIKPSTTTEATLSTELNDGVKTLFLGDIDNQVDVEEEDVTEDIVTISDSDCPGSNLRTCVDACIPLPLLWVYSVCVRECARRCPWPDLIPTFETEACTFGGNKELDNRIGSSLSPFKSDQLPFNQWAYPQN